MIWILLAAHAVTLSANADISPVCQKLHADFIGNEKLMAVIHHANRLGYDADVQFYEGVRQSESNLNAAKARLAAAYGEPFYPQPSKAELEVREAKSKMDADDAEYVSAGDRVTALLIANHCTPPDHVTSWATYPPTP